MLLLFFVTSLAALTLVLTGCTQDSVTSKGLGTSSSQQSTRSAVSRKAAPNPGRDIAWSQNKPDAGALLLLVEDDQNLERVEVIAWIDAAFEEGVRVFPISDQQFVALGSKALQYSGLILPDEIHKLASDTIISSVANYVSAGGHAMLVHDFGAYALDSNQKLTYPIPKSRLSGLAGVDYVLYDALREKSAVVGPIIAERSTLRALQVPPGKSMRFMSNANGSAGTTEPVPVSISAQVLQTGAYQPGSQLAAETIDDKTATNSLQSRVEADCLETYSGYLLGGLKYPSFVTQGAFKGQVLATSPTGGLVAGLQQFGKGQVLFVNLPLTYLKVGRTDALPMHGFLHYFAHTVLRMAQLSPVPNGVAGLTLNWHLDSATAQLPSLRLEKLGVFNDGPFSIDITAGPDAVLNGDRKGWNLNHNLEAQKLLRRLAAAGHEIGSHGGWNHDYYGIQANETNSDVFLPYLSQNVEAVRHALSHPLRPYFGLATATPEGLPASLLPVVKRAKKTVDWLLGPLLREYSPPVGNNPLWAMDWLEQQGVVATYFAGHTGLGPTRHYQDGELRNPTMWVFPVTPQGRYATFEEFQTHAIPREEVVTWYHDLVDFAIANDTTRMIYMHPNGATVWPDVLQNLLDYARSKGSDQFKWYTMTRLADFMTTRSAVQWTEQRSSTGVSMFELSHPSSLDELVWLLPKSRYPDKPVSPDGSATVSEHGAQWLVRPGNTRQARFNAVAV